MGFALFLVGIVAFILLGAWFGALWLDKWSNPPYRPQDYMPPESKPKRQSRWWG